MANFAGVQITNAGKAFLSELISDGITPLKIVRVSLGDGYLPSGQTIAATTGLVSPRADLSISGPPHSIIAPGHVIVEGSISSSQIGTGFAIREIGVWVEKPDTTEILYGYSNAGDDAGFLPAIGSAVAALNIFRINVMVDNAQSVVIVVSPFASEGSLVIDYAIEIQTATAGQTTFTLATLKTYGLSVFINGTETLGFTRVNATTLTLASPASAGNTVIFRQAVLVPMT